LVLLEEWSHVRTSLWTRPTTLCHDFAPSILPSKIGAEHFHALKISTQQPFFIYFVGHYCCGQLLLHLDWCIEWKTYSSVSGRSLSLWSTPRCLCPLCFWATNYLCTCRTLLVSWISWVCQMVGSLSSWSCRRLTGSSGQDDGRVQHI
jgi:hypothetical protein